MGAREDTYYVIVSVLVMLFNCYIGNSMVMDASQGTTQVRAFLHQDDVSCEIATYETSTRTAEEAAFAIGCCVAEIVKSLVLKTTETKTPILVLVSGVNQVDFEKVRQQLSGIDDSLSDEELRMADAKFVKAVTGFPIGGVAPFGHKESMLTVIDADLVDQSTLWAAAGDPYTVFNISPDMLLRMTNGHVFSVS